MSAFLPFVTETSSEEAIFKAIVQRTKGSNTITIANLFSIVLNLGITKARSKLSSYSDDLSTSAKIKELISDNPDFHVPKNIAVFWSYVMRFESSNEESHPVFNTEELEIFFTVLATQKPEAFFDAGFNVEHSKYVKYSDGSFNSGIGSIKGVIITNEDSIRVGFTCWEEFKAYLANRENSEILIRVLPVFIDRDIKEVNQSTYENQHCANPYNRMETNETS